MESYHSEIASNPKVELIHISRDDSEDRTEEWAKKEKMPWPILLKEDTDGETFIFPYFPDGRFGVPSYILVDREGKEITRGRSAVFQKIKEKA